ERLEWRPGAARSALVARIRVRVTRGPLFQIGVRPPPGFTLERGPTATDELVSHIGTPGPAGQVIEFARPLAAGQQAELRLEFVGPGVKPGVPAPFPALVVVGTGERDGWLSASPEPGLGAVLSPGAGAIRAGLWGWLTTDAPADARGVFFFRAKEPDGSLVLAPARAVGAVGAAVRVDLTADPPRATTRLTLAPANNLASLNFFVPGPHDPRRVWHLTDLANAVVGVAAVPGELLGLGPLDPFANLVAERARELSGGTLWVVRFARPLTGAAVIETTASGHLRSADEAEVWFPVPRVVGAAQTVRTDAAPGVATEDGGGAWVKVRAVAQPGLRPVPADQVTETYLVTAVRTPGEAVAAFGGTVRDS
ncbi:MAG: hypothetical protein K2V38_02575, partial [Gemmataceae bacterium]|nr:hypothetical protein [Gemmataceae bacterium]